MGKVKYAIGGAIEFICGIMLLIPPTSVTFLVIGIVAIILGCMTMSIAFMD